MGMFDYITCKMPLPGEPPVFVQPGFQFQTKDLDCYMAWYEITEDGLLKQLHSGAFGSDVDEFIDFSGTIDFYNDNGRAGGYGVWFTPNGEDYESVEYRAKFENGKVVSIIETEHEREPALPVAMLHAFDRNGHTKPAIDLREPEIGAEMFLQYGGSVEGFPVKLVHKTERHWVVVDAEGDPNDMHPTDFGRLLFHSQEDSEKVNGAERAAQQSAEQYFKNALAEREASTK